MAAGKIISKILGIGGTVIDRLIPDKGKNAEMKFELQKALMENEQEIKIAEMEDVKSARELAGIGLRQTKNLFIDILRALPRPGLAIAAGSMWVYSIFQRVNPDIPHLELNYYDYAIISSVIVFYFGGRLMQRLKGKE